MQVSIVCMDIGIQSDSIVTTQHSNAWLCEYMQLAFKQFKLIRCLPQTI